MPNRLSPQVRFEQKYQPEPMSGCWLWMAAIDHDGYGSFAGGERVNGQCKGMRAHRYAYELYRGPIPSGLVLDHLCKTRSCVNPFHLEAVTVKVNQNRSDCGAVCRERNRRITHCPQGHAYSPENTRISLNPKGQPTRFCRACHNFRNARYRAGRRKVNA